MRKAESAVDTSCDAPKYVVKTESEPAFSSPGMAGDDSPGITSRKTGGDLDSPGRTSRKTGGWNESARRMSSQMSSGLTELSSRVSISRRHSQGLSPRGFDPKKALTVDQRVKDMQDASKRLRRRVSSALLVASFTPYTCAVVIIFTVIIGGLHHPHLYTTLEWPFLAAILLFRSLDLAASSGLCLLSS